MRDIGTLKNEFKTDRIAFCFDHRGSARVESYPEYKGSRAEKYKKMKEEDPEQYALRSEFKRQVTLLKTEYLHDMGFRNVFYQDNREADDIIAMQCQVPGNKYTIISSDEDLYQLIGKGVRCYNPITKRIMDANSFTSTYGISPSQWALVKAIAGCKTDDVTGIKGVGEKTAIGYITGSIMKGKKYDSIIEGAAQIKKNEPIVTLPWPETKTFDFQDDEVTPKSWRTFCDRFDMDSLRDDAPLGESYYKNVSKRRRIRT